MKELKELLYGVSIDAVQGSTAIQINQVTSDSRIVEDQGLFVAISGVAIDGHEFIEKALKNGARAVICERIPSDLAETSKISFIRVDNSRKAYGIIASNYYDNPSASFKVIAVTGTNGKTSVSSMLFALFQKLGHRCGLVSTIDIRVGNEVLKTSHTTPDAMQLHKVFHQMKSKGVAFCFMEASSHGIHQFRLSGIDVDTAVFTNLTQDHLDYHQTFAQYRDAKKMLFDQLSPNAFALTNLDDKNGLFMLQNCKANKLTYGLKNHADVKANILEQQFSGTLLRIETQEIWIKLVGEFNVYNIAAVYGVSIALGADKDEVLKELSLLKPVKGRFEFITSSNGIKAVIDYAHTPDAIENVLNTINTLKTSDNRLITLMGCGGNRDQSKRPLMGKIAATLSDEVFFTSDNPRDEDPKQIITQIISGVRAVDRHKYDVVIDRKEAIQKAVKIAQPGDVILIAGKGHETYQEIKGEKQHFDDLEITKNEFAKLN